MKLIAFDTQILIWGVQGSSHPAQKGMIPRTRSLIEEVAKLQSKRQVQLIIPLPAAVEYVCGFPVDEQARQWATLSSRFRLIPFDLRAAQIASKIERQRIDLKPRKVKKTSARKRSASRRTVADVARQKVKVDVQIIAVPLLPGHTQSTRTKQSTSANSRQDLVFKCSTSSLTSFSRAFQTSIEKGNRIGPVRQRLEAARELDGLRNKWLDPPEWTREELLEFPGACAVDQKPGRDDARNPRKVNAEVRLYFFPDESTEVLHVILIGGKRSQSPGGEADFSH